MKEKTRWLSPRLEQEVDVVRWGTAGAPVLMFATAGGDAEEIERFLVIETLSRFIDAGMIRVYSCDSVAGRIMLAGEGTPEYRMLMVNRFQSFVREELVPAIRTDCGDEAVEIVAAGSSIGAFNALASVCRFPEVFRAALCMSGTYDLQRFLKAGITEDFYYSSPLHYLPGLEGPSLDALRRRFILLASGRGRAEDIAESWRAASVLGKKGVPNRVDDWGPEWHHDWPTWRNMLVRYVDEIVVPDSSDDGADTPAESAGA